MGTTIADTIRQIDEYNYKYQGKICPSEGLDMIVETIQKYQKIEEILNDDTYYENYGNNAEHFIVSAIKEVLEDGKINQCR